MSEIVDSGHKYYLNKEKGGGMGSSRGKESRRMTIIYAGQVMVLHDFPADKAMEIMMLASRKHSAPNDLGVSSDLPLARKASLARFLEKRKERITARAAAAAAASASEYESPSKQSKASMDLVN